ncbi:MAG: hypothetical protein ABUK13_02730 [Gammaproteobacteria bacterium]
MTEENSQEQEIAEDVVAYSDMSWQKLKALMTAEGQEWVNAEHAIEYLTKLDEADDSESSNDADTTEEGSSQETDESPEPSAEEDLDPESAAPDGADESTDAVTDLATDSEVDDSDDSDEDEVINDESLVTDPEDNTPRFDPDAKHGVISGQCNARYWQNGCHFDSQGQYIAPEDVVVESEETD